MANSLDGIFYPDLRSVYNLVIPCAPNRIQCWCALNRSITTNDLLKGRSNLQLCVAYVYVQYLFGTPCMYVPYSLDQTPLSISCRSRIVAASPEVLNEIVAALE